MKILYWWFGLIVMVLLSPVVQATSLGPFYTFAGTSDVRTKIIFYVDVVTPEGGISWRVCPKNELVTGR